MPDWFIDVPKPLKPCLAHSGHSVNTCSVNKSLKQHPSCCIVHTFPSPPPTPSLGPIGEATWLEIFRVYLLFRHCYVQLSEKQWHPTPVLSPGKSHGWRSLVGCSPWGRYESDMTSLSLSLSTFTHWRRKWQPTPAFLPGKSHGWGSLVGCHLWGRTESDTTEAT